MIKIKDKTYKAEQTIEVHHDTSIPVQPVESGFNVQDNVKHEPTTVKIDILIYDTEENILHGRWEWTVVDGERVAVERTELDPTQGTYDYLIGLRDDADPFLLDCSDHAREASMIFPDMIISHVGQVVQKGGSYWCSVYFTQIIKTVIVTEDFYVQEYGDDGETNIRWSKEPLKEPSTESLSTMSATESVPSIQRNLPGVGTGLFISGMVDSIFSWVYGR